MGASVGPKIVRPNDGMIMYYDSHNTNSFPYHAYNRDHGISDWVCMESGLVYWASAIGGGAIYEYDASSGLTEVVVEMENKPTYGSLSVTAGYRYWGSVPIHLHDAGDQNRIVPLSLSSNLFGSSSNRYTTTIYWMYSPFEDCDVEVFENVSGGVTGTPTTTISLTAGVTATYTSASQNHEIFFKTTGDEHIVMTRRTTSSNGDKGIISPMANQVYARGYGHEQRWNEVNSPADVSASFYTSDSTYKVFSSGTGDGAGGDYEMGLGLEYLSNRYVFGQRIAGYHYVTPYNTTITVHYWDSASQSWTLYDTHITSNSTLSSPEGAQIGNKDEGVPGATSLSVAKDGIESYMWKWEANEPFYVMTNDTAGDEMTIHGWDSTRQKRGTNDADTTLYDLTHFKNNAQLINFNDGLNEVNQLKRFTLDKTNWIRCDGDLIGGDGIAQNYTLEAWIYLEDDTGLNIDVTGNGFSIIGNDDALGVGIQLYKPDSIKVNFGARSNSNDTGSISIQLNTWYHIVGARANQDNGTVWIYVNGEIDFFNTGENLAVSNTTAPMKIGTAPSRIDTVSGPFPGKIELPRVYNRALTPDEVYHNFQAHRGRFGV